MISNETIDKVSQIPILDIAEKYLSTKIRKSGVNYVTECPWHKDKHPSFTISQAKGIAKCFVCDKSVNGISLVMDINKSSYPEAIRTIAHDFNIKVQETGKQNLSEEDKQKYKQLESLVIASTWAADYYHTNLLAAIEKYYPGNKFYSYFPTNHHFLNIEHRTIAYILNRFKFDIELIKKFKIGYAAYGFDNLLKAAKKAGYKSNILLDAGLVKKATKNNNEYYRDAFVYRPLMIPIHSAKGKIVAFSARKMPWQNATNESGKAYPKYINSADSMIYKKSKILYGFNLETQAEIRQKDKVYIVEGNTDKTSLFAIGIKNVVAKSGTSFTDEQIELLKKRTKNICLLDDGDAAGQKSMLKNGEKLTKAKCNVTVITLPEKEDPDSFFTSETQFKEYEKQHEIDYIIDIRAIPELEAATNINQKQKVRNQIAKLLLFKDKEDRTEYIDAIVKETETSRTDWNKSIKRAAFKNRDKGLNIAEENEEKAIIPNNSPDNFKKHNFYKLKKNKERVPTGIEIDERMFLLKLKSTEEIVFEEDGFTKRFYFGFYSYSTTTDEEDMIFVQLKHGKIKKVSINYIKRTFFQFVRMLQPIEYTYQRKDAFEDNQYLVTSKDIELLLLKKVTTLFEEKKLVLFPDKKIKLLQDTLDSHYTFYKNCYVISDKNGYNVHEYENLKDGYVWDDAVLNRNFKKQNSGTGVFEKFVHDISGNNWNLEKNTSDLKESLRYKALLIAGGYALHNFTNMQRKAVILTQGNISEDDNAEGREGKTMFVQSLGRYMLNKEPKKSKTFVYVPGKDLKADDKHKWQDLELNTTCVLYDDPPPWINFESLYNLAEDSFKVEKKRQANIYVESRIFITTNRPIDRDSGSSKARSCVIELDSIFNSEYTPKDKYKHFFFRDWENERADEWSKFDNYVLGKMLPAYFANNNNLLEPASKNLYRNELLQKARRLSGSTEIVFWLDFLSRGDEENEAYFKLSCSYTTKDLYAKLLVDRDYKDNKKLKLNFAKIVKAYFEKEKIEVEERRVASGKEFTILSGLRERVTIDENLFVDFFNNEDFDIDGLTEPIILETATKTFNNKYNQSLTNGLFKKQVDKLIASNSDLPF